MKKPTTQHDLSLPITSGYESILVRSSTPWQKNLYLLDENRIAERGPNSAPPPLANTRALVYSSISDKKSSLPLSDRAYRIDIYTESVRIIRPKIPTPENILPPDRTGTEIEGFSQKSKHNLQVVAANSADRIKSQICLTYGDNYPTDGKEAKHHLNKFLQKFRYHFPDDCYLWVLEFQTRAAPHFHVFTSLEPTPENHSLLVKLWYEASGSTQEKVMRVHLHEKNFIPWSMGNGGYLCKYLDKDHQKVVPENYSNVGRFWGHSKDLKPVIRQQVEKDEIELFGKENWSYLIRNICRYQEKLNNRSTIRRTPQSRTLLTGAKITRKLAEYVCPGSVQELDKPELRPDLELQKAITEKMQSGEQLNFKLKRSKPMAKNFKFCNLCGKKIHLQQGKHECEEK